MKNNEVISGLSGLLKDYDNLKSHVEFLKHEAKYYYEQWCKQNTYIYHLRKQISSGEDVASAINRAVKEYLDKRAIPNFSISIPKDKQQKIIEILNEGEEVKWIM